MQCLRTLQEVIEKNWLALADQVKDLPVPFEQTVFLTDCHRFHGRNKLRPSRVKLWYNVRRGEMLQP